MTFFSRFSRKFVSGCRRDRPKEPKEKANPAVAYRIAGPGAWTLKSLRLYTLITLSLSLSLPPYRSLTFLSFLLSLSLSDVPVAALSSDSGTHTCRRIRRCSCKNRSYSI